MYLILTNISYNKDGGISMSQLTKRLKKEVVISSIIYILVGMLFLFYPTMSANIIAYILGGTILAFGIGKVLVYRKLEEIHMNDRMDLFIGAIALGGGVFIFFNPPIVLSILPFIAGIFMIIEAFSLMQTIQPLKTNKDSYNISFILMMILFIGGIIILINPFKIAKTVLMIIGAFFILDGISQLYTTNQIKKLIHH